MKSNRWLRLAPFALALLSASAATGVEEIPPHRQKEIR